MVFVPKTWQDSPSTATPITKAELERLEAGIVEGTQDASELQKGNVELASTTEMTAGTHLTNVPSVRKVADYVNLKINESIAVLPGVAEATESVPGIVELADAAEMTAGTDTTRPPSVKVIVDYVELAVSTPANFSPPVTFTAPSATVIPLTLAGAPSQSSHLLTFADSAGTVIGAVDKNGEVRPGASASMIGMFKALCRAATVPGLSLRAALGQTADIIEVQNNSGVVKMTVDPTGRVNGQNVGTIPGTTVSFAPLLVLASAAAVPAGTPAGTVILRRPV